MKRMKIYRYVQNIMYFFPDFKFYFSHSNNAQFPIDTSQQADLILRRDIFRLHSNCTVLDVITVKEQIIQDIHPLVPSSQTEFFPYFTF